MNERHSVTTLAVHALPVGDDHVVKHLPLTFRVQSIARLYFDGHDKMNRAVLFHERASLTVEWLSRSVDVRIVTGGLVSIRWLGRPTCVKGAVRIARLVPLDRPEPSLNLFDTVPSNWLADRALLRRAGAHWDGLQPSFRHLFNAIFWQGDRFRRYLNAPSSLSGHHAGRSGNLRHTVDVVERVVALGIHEKRVDLGILILAAFLHDAGKADEYRVGYRNLELSARGKLIGHRLTVIEWIAAAQSQHRVLIDEQHYLALLHVLGCAKGAPAWLGLREPQSLEAILLSAADRLSGQSDLINRCAPGQPGFGRYHRHLGARPFVVTAQP